MNPFDAPPSTPAVSYEPPRHPKRRRGRVIGAAVLGAGLVGAGAVGVSTLVSADDPELGATTTTSAPGPDEAGEQGEGLDSSRLGASGWMVDVDEDELRRFRECIGLPEIWSGSTLGEDFDLEELPALDELFGEDFSLDEWFGEFEGEFPVLDELFGEDFSAEEWFGEFEGEFPALDELFGEDFSAEEWFGEFEGEFPALDELFGEDFSAEEWFGEFEGEFPAPEEWAVDGGFAPLHEEFDALLSDLDGLIVVMGHDGPVVVDLGDGDGSVTIERDGGTGEVTITTDGEAAEVDLDGLFEEWIVPMIPDEVQTCLDELTTRNG